MTCPLCTDRAKSEIWRNGNFYLIDAEDPAFPCFLRVVSCRHVPEMSSLTSEERTELWGILNVVEEEIIKALRPHKVNLAQFGNMVPHLHWHVIPRWKNDPWFPDSVWSAARRSDNAADTKARQLLAEQFFKALPRALNAAFQ